MMKNINFKDQVLPHVVAIVIFLLITLIFYSPLFFDNKTLSQHDITQGIGGGQEIREYRMQNDDEALWTNAMFGGMPAYLINIQWSGNLVKYIETIISLGLASTPAVTFLSFITFYFLLLVFGVRPYIAIIGALAYGLNSFNIISIGAGHIWKMRAIAYMPLVLAGAHLIFSNRSKKIYGFIVLVLGIALEIKANHLQITYYLLLMLIIYGINVLVYALKDKDYPGLLKNISYTLAAAILAIGCNLGQLWATYEYGQYSTRGPSDLVSGEVDKNSGLDKEYVFRWSSGKMESFTFLVPNVYGGSSSESLISDKDSNTLKALRQSNNAQAQQLARYATGYWGEQPGTSPLYVGAIICFLALLGAIVLDHKARNWILVGILLSIMLSWGHNFSGFNDFMYNYFPLYNKFRAVTMVLVIAFLLIPLLAFVGLEKVLSSEWNKKMTRKLMIAFASSAGICLIFIVIPGIFDFQKSFESQLPAWLMDAMIEDRKGLLQADAFRSIIFILLTVGIIFLFVKRIVSGMVIALILCVLVLADLWTVDRRYLNKENYRRKTKDFGFTASEANKRIDNDKLLHDRVLNLLGTWSEASTSYYHASIGGYHGAKIRRYQELIEHCLDDQKNAVINQLRSGSTNFSGTPALNMLNTRHIKFGESADQVIINHYAYGNAWVSKNIVEVQSANEEIEQTCQLQDQSTNVIDVSRFPISAKNDVTGDISLTSYAPNKLTYNATLDGNGVVVFSEIYYPNGWKAYVDGEESPIIRANYVLRALEVPEGKHEIVFEFKPNAYYVGNTIMAVVSVIVLLLLLTPIVFFVMDKRNA